MGNVGASLKMNGIDWAVVTCLFAESEEELEAVVDELYSVSTRRKLIVSAEKSKVRVFEIREVEVVDINTPYRGSVPAVEKCGALLGMKWRK